MSGGSGGSLARAESLLELGRHAEAREILAPLATDDGDGHTWCLLSQCDLGLGHPGRALQAADQAVAARPDLEWGYRLRSVALSRLGRHEQAIAAARDALLLAPHSWIAHIALADALIGAGDRPAEAVSVARSAVGLAPADAATHFTLARAQSAAKDEAAAERSYLKALEIDPSHAPARNNLGVIALRNRRAGKAVDLFSSSVRANPSLHVAAANTELAVKRLLARICSGLVLGAFVFSVLAAGQRAAPDGAVASPLLRPALTLALLGAVLAYVRRTAGRLGWDTVRVLLARPRVRLSALMLGVDLLVLLFYGLAPVTVAAGASQLYFWLLVLNVATVLRRSRWRNL